MYELAPNIHMCDNSSKMINLKFFNSINFNARCIESIAANENDLIILYCIKQNKFFYHFCLKTETGTNFSLSRVPWLYNQKTIQTQVSNNMFFICTDKYLVGVKFKSKRCKSVTFSEPYSFFTYTCFAVNKKYMFFVTKDERGNEEIWRREIDSKTMTNVSELINAERSEKDPQTSIKNLTASDNGILYSTSDNYIHYFCLQTKNYKMYKSPIFGQAKCLLYREKELILVFEKYIKLLNLTSKKSTHHFNLSRYCNNGILSNVVVNSTNGKIIFNCGNKVVILAPRFERIKILPFSQIISDEEVDSNNYYTKI